MRPMKVRGAPRVRACQCVKQCKGNYRYYDIPHAAVCAWEHSEAAFASLASALSAVPVPHHFQQRLLHRLGTATTVQPTRQEVRI